MEAGYFEQSWRVVCFGGFLFGREAVRRMVPKGKGTLLFTGASASLRGRSGYGAFNSSKAGLRALAQAMAKEYAGDGIHVGHVVIDMVRSAVKDKAFPRRAASRGGPIDQHRGHRRRLRFLYKQPRRAQSLLKTRRANIARELVRSGGYSAAVQRLTWWIACWRRRSDDTSVGH
jgi:NAD(P)-dependent dehydrogenase (short-subunit alcohol dehydrogenase family)